MLLFLLLLMLLLLFLPRSLLLLLLLGFTCGPTPFRNKNPFRKKTRSATAVQSVHVLCVLQ